MQNEKKNDRYKLILARNHVGKNDRDSQERGIKKRVEVYYDREKETFTVTNGGVPNGKNNVNEQEPLKKIVEKYFVKPKEKNKQSEKEKRKSEKQRKKIKVNIRPGWQNEKNLERSR